MSDRKWAVLGQASRACDALRRMSGEGFREAQNEAWSLAFSAIQSLADYVEDHERGEAEALRPVVAYLVGAEHAPDCGERAEWVKPCSCGLTNARNAIAPVRQTLHSDASRPQRATPHPTRGER
jgi:hypothetical protein